MSAQGIFFNGRECIVDVERNEDNIITSAKIIIGEGRDKASVPLEAIKIDDRIGSRYIKYSFVSGEMIEHMLEGQTFKIEYEWENGESGSLFVKYHAPKVHVLLLGDEHSNNLQYVYQNKKSFETSLENLIRKNSIYSIELDVYDTEDKESALQKIDAWKGSVQKGDLVVIYMNGHGEINKENEEWGLRTSDGILRGVCLIDKVREIAAKEAEVRIVVDACYSEALVSDFDELGDKEAKYISCLFSSERNQESIEVNGSSLLIKSLTSEISRMQGRAEQNYDIVMTRESSFMKAFKDRKQNPGKWTADEGKLFDILPSYDSIEDKKNIVGKSILPFWGINEIDKKGTRIGLYALDAVEMGSLALFCAGASLAIPKTVNPSSVDLNDRLKSNTMVTMRDVSASVFIIAFVSSAIWTNGELKLEYDISKRKGSDSQASLYVAPYMDKYSAGFGLALNF